MNKIPTARQFASGKAEAERMIEFAKLHVKAALKAATKKSIMLRDLGENEKNDFVTENLKSYNDEDGYPIYIDKDSILNAYPLTNIT